MEHRPAHPDATLASPQTEEGTSSTIKPAADQAAAKAHQTIDRLSESAVRTEQQLRENVAKAEAQLREFTDKAQTTADAQVEELKTYIEQKPLQSAGIAFAAGLVLSRILR